MVLVPKPSRMNRLLQSEQGMPERLLSLALHRSIGGLYGRTLIDLDDEWLSRVTSNPFSETIPRQSQFCHSE